MGLNKQILNKVVDFVKKVKELPDTEDFISDLREVVGVSLNNASNVKESSKMDGDIRYIREILCMRSDITIDYDFIAEDEYPHLKRQLIVDNIRMEDAILDTREKSEYVRFYNFCANAFYQIENIVNHYYFVNFPNIQDCVAFITNNTGYIDRKNGQLKINEDGSIEGQFRSSGRKIQAVGDIDISYKLTAFMRVNNFEYWQETTIENLRKVRNLGAHRCMSIWGTQSVSQLGDNKLKPIFSFYQYNTPDKIRSLLRSLVQTVKQSL